LIALRVAWSITLDRYSHLFDRARHADDLREPVGASAFAAAVAGEATSGR
jgi:hypothetical protein